MFKLLNRAGGPSESTLSVSEVTHDESILPWTPCGTWAAQVRRRRRAIMHTAQSVEERGEKVDLVITNAGRLGRERERERERERSEEPGESGKLERRGRVKCRWRDQ